MTAHRRYTLISTVLRRNKTLRYLYRTFFVLYILCRQMYTVLCYLTQFVLLNAAQYVSSLYKAHLQGLFC
jgi:hypothetical protein